MYIQETWNSSPIAHIGYIVDRLNKNLVAFRDLCGVDRFEVYDFRPSHAWVNGKEIGDCHFQIAMGTAHGGIGIELIQPISGSTPHMEFLNRGGGMHHFSIRVKDIETVKSHFLRLPNADMIFEAEIYDETRGYRRCIYVQMDKTCPVVEYAQVEREPPDGFSAW